MITKNQLQFLAAQALNIRIDSLRATTAAGSGHPTSCLSAADMIAVLFFHVLRYDYKNPKFANNDRFILSKGHAIPVVYSALHQLGVITDQQLLSLRKFDSELEGHPTPRFAYNEASTGSLGQGLSIGLGMALNARYEKLSYKTYVMMGDAEISEGSIWEAAELAGRDNVDNLIGLVDCNRLGQADPSLYGHDTGHYARQFEAFGWKAIMIDGHDIKEIIQAIDQAHQVKNQPTVIIAKTIKGYGLEGIENLEGYHGKAFKKDELPLLIDKLRTRFSSAASYQGPHGAQMVRDASLLTTSLHSGAHPEESDEALAKTDVSKGHGNITIDLTKDTNVQAFGLGKKLATRKGFGLALAALGKASEDIFTFDADVKNSTYTDLFEKEFPERFVECFIAEQNMIGVATGFALRGKISFASTFAAFFSRAYDQVRMAGIGRVALRLCGSHSGVSIGEDGPSQMGLEDLAMMRAIPQSVVLWPSDGVSAYKLVELMANYHDGISYMKSTRADTSILYEKDEKFSIGGCKLLISSSTDRACIVSAGITLHEALIAGQTLREQGINVSIIDLYSIKPLDAKTVIDVARASGGIILTVEDHYLEGGLGEAVMAAVCNTGLKIHALGVRQLSRSGTPEELMKFAGIDADSIVKKIKEFLL